MSSDTTSETLFTCSYRHAGSQWAFDIYARDEADAHARLQAIRTTGQVDGEVGARIPVNHLTLPLGWAWVKLSELWSRL